MRAIRLFFALTALAMFAAAQTDWPTFGHDSGGNRYSPLKQITPANVNTLTRAWTYHMNPGGAAPAASERGAKLSEDEMAEVVEYLTVNFGPQKSATRVNVNHAGAGVLVSELGLTQRDAMSIVKYREANGPFKDLSSLKKVPDLDPAKIDTRKDRLAF